MSNKCDVIPRTVYEQVAWERDIAIQQLSELGYGLGEKIDKVSDKQKIAELEDVAASWQSRYESLFNEVEQILIEGEPTDIGIKVTLIRLRELIGLNKLEKIYYT